MKAWLASIPVTTLLLYIFASVLSLLLLAYLAYLAWGAWKRLDELELKDRFAARNDFIKTTAQILGGAFFLFGLYFTWANLIATQEKNVTDLYTKAIEQLGNDKREVRVGGIYALERIARQSPKDHWTIMEVLMAYVRGKAPGTAASEATPAKAPSPGSRREVPPQPGEQTSEEKPKPETDIQAVLTVLGRTAMTYRQKGEKRTLDLSATHLAGADLKEADLQGAKLIYTNLQKAVLSGAKLQGAVLREAKLQDSDLRYANLEGADLRQANLQGAHFVGANLQGADLARANLEWAKLWGANLQGAKLWGAKLGWADLRGQEGQDVGARGLTAKEVAVAFWDENTQWPEGFTPPPRRDPPQPHKDEKKAGE